MPIATTERLTLREMTLADLGDIASLLGDERVMTYYPRAKTREEAQGWIEWNRRLYRDRGFGLWVISRRGTGEFVGDCGLTVQHVDGVEEVEVGYHVRVEQQGRGFATEAAIACRDLARERFSLDRLIAIINPVNLPSQKVAMNIGLRFEKRASVYGHDRTIWAARF